MQREQNPNKNPPPKTPQDLAEKPKHPPSYEQIALIANDMAYKLLFCVGLNDTKAISHIVMGHQGIVEVENLTWPQLLDLAQREDLWHSIPKAFCLSSLKRLRRLGLIEGSEEDQIRQALMGLGFIHKKDQHLWVPGPSHYTQWLIGQVHRVYPQLDQGEAFSEKPDWKTTR